MSRHEIEIEGLPEGLEPQEIRKPRLGDIVFFGAGIAKPWDTSAEGTYPALILRRKVRKYDHSKTMDDVLVITSTEGMYHYGDRSDKATGIAGVWQPNIHGKCPVDGEATWVRVKHLNGETFEALASDVNWAIGCEDDDVIAWQFIRLDDGYEW